MNLVSRVLLGCLNTLCAFYPAIWSLAAGLKCLNWASSLENGHWAKLFLLPLAPSAPLC